MNVTNRIRPHEASRLNGLPPLQLHAQWLEVFCRIGFACRPLVFISLRRESCDNRANVDYRFS